MYTIEVSRRRLLSAMEYFKDKAIITVDSEHHNMWVSGLDTRIRVPLIRQVGRGKINPFYLTGVIPHIEKLETDRLHLTFYKKTDTLIIEETFIKEWTMQKPHRTQLFIEREPLEKRTYTLPTLHFELMSGLQCIDGTLTIDCEAVAGTELIRKSFLKHDTKYPDFKISQFAMSNLKNFRDTTVTIQFCENKHILIRGAYFNMVVVNQI